MQQFSHFCISDDKKELFNPDCRNSALLNNIKERCDCDEEGKWTLSVGNCWRVAAENRTDIPYALSIIESPCHGD